MCGAKASSRLISTQVEEVVVSEGPYKLHTVPTAVMAKMRSTNMRLSGSPAKFIRRTVSRMSHRSRSVFMVDGTVLMSVISMGSRAKSSAFLTTLTVAPTVSGTKHSYTAKSKFSEVEKSVRSRTSRVKDNWAQQIKFTELRCSTATPFGMPVEPEV